MFLLCVTCRLLVLPKHPVSRLLVVLSPGREAEYPCPTSVELKSAGSDGAVLN
jgi:hypothetical protein